LALQLRASRQQLLQDCRRAVEQAKDEASAVDAVEALLDRFAAEVVEAAAMSSALSGSKG